MPKNLKFKGSFMIKDNVLKQSKKSDVRMPLLNGTSFLNIGINKLYDQISIR